MYVSSRWRLEGSGFRALQEKNDSKIHSEMARFVCRDSSWLAGSFFLAGVDCSSNRTR